MDMSSTANVSAKRQKSKEAVNSIICYKRFFFVHVFLFETPLAIIESFLRSLFFILAIILSIASSIIGLILLNGYLFYYSLSFIKSFLLEALISFSLSVHTYLIINILYYIYIMYLILKLFILFIFKRFL